MLLALCCLSTMAMFRHPSIFRNLICMLATRLKSNISAASSFGNEPCVFTRRRNSSCSRSGECAIRISTRPGTPPTMVGDRNL
jgi:hypothetical protein